MTKLADHKYENRSQPPYSTAIAPADYFLFPNEEVKQETEAYFEALYKSDITKDVEIMEERWEKYPLEEDYFILRRNIIE